MGILKKKFTPPFSLPLFSLFLLPLRCVLKDQDKEYVGFATLPNQVHRKSVKKGFDFTLMVAGQYNLYQRATLRCIQTSV